MGRHIPPHSDAMYANGARAPASANKPPVSDGSNPGRFRMYADGAATPAPTRPEAVELREDVARGARGRDLRAAFRPRQPPPPSKDWN